MMEEFLAHGLHCNKYRIDHALTHSLTIPELSLKHTYRSTKLSDDHFFKMYPTFWFRELCIAMSEADVRTDLLLSGARRLIRKA